MEPLTIPPSRWLRWLVTAFAVAGAAAWFVPYIDGADVWWHIASGREWFVHHAVPRVDPLSFTSHQEWVNHEWLWGVLAYSLFHVDPQLLAWGNFALLALIFWLGFEQILQATRSLTAATLALWLAAANGHWFFDLRPHLFTLLFSVLLVVTRRWRHAPWLWPPVIALWCNLHAGYVFGVGLLGLGVLVDSLYEYEADATPMPLTAAGVRQRVHAQRMRWLALGLCVPAICLNPWGYHLLEFPLSYAPGTGRSLYADQIVEWQHFGFSWDELQLMGVRWLLSFRGLFLATLCMALPGAWQRLRRDPFAVSLALVSVLMALGARRFVALSALLCAPLVACTLERVLARVVTVLGEASAPVSLHAARLLRAPLAAAAALAACLPLLWHDTRVLPQLFERWSMVDAYPRAATRYLAALASASAAPLRVLNYELWGGYVMVNAPRCRVFFDGRASTVYDETLYVDYLALLNGEADLGALLAKYRPDAVLVPRSGLADRLLQLTRVTTATPAWQLAYADETALLLLPNDSPLLAHGLPAPERVLGSEPQWLRHQAAVARARGDEPRAVALLQQALTREPLSLGAYAELMSLFAQRGQLEAVRLVADTALANLPQRHAPLHAQLGHLYEARGLFLQAQHEYLSALTGNPLVVEDELRAHLHELRAKLARTP